MLIKFWGVRGSVPSGNKETCGIGGNTTCVEVRCGKETLIFDAGTGIRNLGNNLDSQNPFHARIFFTHVHWDHIQGLPFFPPIYQARNEFTIYGGTFFNESIYTILKKQMSPPVFPVSLEDLPATFKFESLQKGQVLQTEDFVLKHQQINHPNGALAFRVDTHNRSMVFATDVEPVDGKLDPGLVEFCRGTDVLIHDAQYTREEYLGLNGHHSRVGWGHSTPNDAVRLAQAAEVKFLALFHHDPSHDDEFIKNIEAESRKQFPDCVAAYEGLEIDFKNSFPPVSFFD